jgi:hypothetical protein
MKLQTFTYRTGSGWSMPLPQDLDSEHTLVLAFAAPEFRRDPAPLQQLATAFGQSVVVGCSTAGEITGTLVQDASISVAVARFTHTCLRSAAITIRGAADSYDAGQRLAQALQAPDLRAVFVLSDGLHVNGTPLVDGIGNHLGAGVAVTGGLAGDGSRFGETWTLHGAQLADQCILAVGFYGDHVRVSHGCEGGWSDFGPERLITRSEGNVLYELDGKPALELYRTYLGERAQGLPGTALLFPLSVHGEGVGQDKLVRTILGIDEATQSLTFAGDVPQGAMARLMRANTDKLIDSAGQAAREAVHDTHHASDSLVISVSCVGRRLVLGERTEEEVETVVQGAPQGAAHIGFYSYGEICPASHGKPSELHNQTMTVTVISEA